ncbi:MAG: hypothetical protein K0S61_4741 [Anaerocolumna sp.]|jgi:hypothetical protein|nr:hypothetical protein [Anaerocolumna sp.]
MSEIELIYNKPFEHENWIWEINDIRYYVNKYRKIDSDKEMGFYYDFIILEFNDSNGERLFHIRKYHKEKRMSLFCNPYIVINTNLSEMILRLKGKYEVEDFYYFEIGKGYQILELP